MNKLPTYPDYLICSIDEDTASSYALENGLEKRISWFRVPSTLDDVTEIFARETTAILDRKAWSSLSPEEYEEKSLSKHSNVKFLFAKDFHIASRYAAKRNWSLRTWKFVEDVMLDEEVIEYGFYC